MHNLLTPFVLGKPFVEFPVTKFMVAAVVPVPIQTFPVASDSNPNDLDPFAEFIFINSFTEDIFPLKVASPPDEMVRACENLH